jgi:hypothetical protein
LRHLEYHKSPTYFGEKMRLKIVTVVLFALGTLSSANVFAKESDITKNISVAKLKKSPYYKLLFEPDLSEYSLVQVKEIEIKLACIDRSTDVPSELPNLTQGISCFVFMNLTLLDILQSAKDGSFMIHTSFWNELNPAQQKTVEEVAALYLKDPKLLWPLYENVQADQIYPFAMNKMTIALRCGKKQSAKQLYEALLEAKKYFLPTSTSAGNNPDLSERAGCDTIIATNINDALNDYRKSMGMKEEEVDGTEKDGVTE